MNKTKKINVITGPAGATLKTILNSSVPKNEVINVLRKTNKALLGEVAKFEEI